MTGVARPAGERAGSRGPGEGEPDRDAHGKRTDMKASGHVPRQFLKGGAERQVAAQDGQPQPRQRDAAVPTPYVPLAGVVRARLTGGFRIPGRAHERNSTELYCHSTARYHAIVLIAGGQI